MASYLKNDTFKFYRFILLLMCMDIHVNPGPVTNDIHSIDIMHLNTRSIRHKMDYLSNMAEAFHIVCCSETHLAADVDTNDLIIEGFDDPIRKDRTRNGGGIIVYMSSHLKYKRRNELESPLIENIWVQIKLKSFDIIICCYYRSDFTVSQSIFITEMQASIEQALDLTPYIVLVGDINIDFLNMQNTQLRDCLSLFNLTNVIEEPTRVTENSSTLIDPIIVSDNCKVLDSGTMDVDEYVSDHKATYVSVEINMNLSKSYYREVWNYRNADVELLNNLVENYNWDNIINDNTTVDEACMEFTNAFLQFCKRSIPRKNVLIRQNDKPWFNSELRFNIKLRDRLRKKFYKTNRDADHIKFKQQRNKVNNMKKFAKENYINNIEDTVLNKDSGNSCKTFWQVMGRFMGKKGTSVIIPPLEKQDNTYAFTDEDKANELNDFFSSVSTINDTNIELPYFDKRSRSEITAFRINQSEVQDTLKILKINKATGPDGISNRMLKLTINTITVPLTKLFNLSLSSYTYPDLWKVSHVMPLFKKGDKSIASNYRPVSLTSNVGKSFERIVFKHIYNHITMNDLLYKYQSGFLPGHSTVHHLIELIHNTCLSLENYEINCQIFCDISKAFDRVWHRGLLYKLEKYGVTGDLLLWLESYLTNRMQKTFVNGVLSADKSISAGVPQGSVLGPLLFLIYINDIADNLAGKARLYADDTSLSFSSSDPAQIETVLNDDLVKLKEWADKWMITFNPLKTEVMMISNIFNDYNFQLKFDNTSLNLVETHRHLGVNLSSNNKWGSHINCIIDSASKQLSYLRKLKYKLSKNTLSKLYCTYIRPLLEYASEVWDGCNTGDSYRLEQVQLNAARIVTGLPVFASIQSLYSETGWETLSARRKQRKLILMYKIINDNVPSYLKDLMPDRINETTAYNLRNSDNYEIPFTRLCSFETSYFPSTLKSWNDLDTQIRTLPTLKQFKSNIRKKSDMHTDKLNNYLMAGERKFNVILTRIRHKCSSLKADLCNVNIIPYSICSCGAQSETADHFFFECNLYNDQRDRLFRNLNQNVVINLQLLTDGSPYLDFETNKKIILSVLKFIKDSHRFD